MGPAARMGDVRSAHNILVEKPEGKTPLRRPSRRWEGNIRLVLRETGWKGVDWTHVTQDWDKWRAFVNTIMNLRVL